MSSIRESGSNRRSSGAGLVPTILFEGAGRGISKGGVIDIDRGDDGREAEEAMKKVEEPSEEGGEAWGAVG